MAQIKSVGKCPYCEKMIAKRSISQHLETHLKSLPPSKNKNVFHLRIETDSYFLQLLIDNKTTLNKLDRFLRQIWLECCGHLSQFSVGGAWGESVKQSQMVKDVLSQGVKLNYVYDFGSSTELVIKVIGEHPIEIEKNIKLLSRNEPLEFLCHSCKTEAATQLCSVHFYEDTSHLFCDDCAIEHEEECSDAADYAWLEVVNSPRMGVCAYEGGMIDTERDGVFQMNED